MGEQKTSPNIVTDIRRGQDPDWIVDLRDQAENRIRRGDDIPGSWDDIDDLLVKYVIMREENAALRTRADTLAAEVGRLRGALEDIAAMRSWAGVWMLDCECGKRLPQIFDKADAALRRRVEELEGQTIEQAEATAVRLAGKHGAYGALMHALGRAWCDEHRRRYGANMPDPSPITIWREESQREKARADAAERERDTLAAEVKRLNEALRLSMPGASDAMLAALRAGEADGVEGGKERPMSDSPPRRRHEVRISIGADTWDEAKRILEGILRSMDEHPDGRMSSVSGGYASGHTVEATVDESVTHDSYHAALEAWLERSGGGG